MVKAIDVKTIGLGGDSEISIGLNGKLDVGPQRVAPISLLAVALPGSRRHAGGRPCRHRGRLDARQVRAEALWRRPPPSQSAEVNRREAEILAMVDERPRPIRKIAVSSAAQRALASLKRKGLVQTRRLHAIRRRACAGSSGQLAAALPQNLPRKLLVRFRDMKLGDAATGRELLPRGVVGNRPPHLQGHSRHGLRQELRRS